jgi:hypothetical protein
MFPGMVSTIKAVAVKFKGVAVLSQASKELSRQPLIAEDLQPPAKLQVRGNEKTPLLQKGSFFHIDKLSRKN